MMAEYDKSDFVPKSFADARNTNVNLVQVRHDCRSDRTA